MVEILTFSTVVIIGADYIGRLRDEFVMMYVSMYVYVYVCVCVCVCMCMCVYVYVCVCVCTCYVGVAGCLGVGACTWSE